ncbi:MerR family transcriptional regulator [Paenibacillus wulumuqiensis]|uniref:MerR family transcriptional regulator n=1 Tax=Paenibacillus wulumuqiensis TaxID=1567107 RepID=UPI000619CE85|nr:MerR family transcriptional regulator [Paenibacillus wulumuqiensis]
MKYYSIGEAAAHFQVPESTLRYYERQGLLPLMERDAAGRRLFSEDQMTLLKIVVHLKHTHMPIRTIRQYVDWVIEGDQTIQLRLEMMQRHKQAVLDEISVMTEALKGIDTKINRYLKRTQPTN